MNQKIRASPRRVRPNRRVMLRILAIGDRSSSASIWPWLEAGGRDWGAISWSRSLSQTPSRALRRHRHGNRLVLQEPELVFLDHLQLQDQRPGSRRGHRHVDGNRLPRRYGLGEREGLAV